MRHAVNALAVALALVLGACASRHEVEEAHEAQLASERRGRERRAAPRARELARDAGVQDAATPDAAEILKQLEALGVDRSVPWGHGGYGTEEADAGE